MATHLMENTSPLTTCPGLDVDAFLRRGALEPQTASTDRPLRVCVINASYEGSESVMKDYDDLNVGPHHYIDAKDPRFEITVKPIKKATCYRDIRVLAKSGKYDVFYNMCDGCRDEDRAGVEVVQALEEFGVPFTGACSKLYEITKPEMKMIAYYQGIETARSAVVESIPEAERKCAQLRFPVLIKHPSGYSSVGMTKDCKCYDMASLLSRLVAFIEEYQTALVEEFIDGDEVTVLACADSSQPDGVRVFQPVMVSFPEGEDFKHFDLKWVGFEGMSWKPVPSSHKSYAKMIEVARRSFKFMMDGIGYGRTDMRIDRATGEPYFLEINSQPGMMYPPTQEASSDHIMLMDPEWDHQSFAILQMQEAFRSHFRNQPLYFRDFDHTRGYHLRASRAITKGSVVIHDEGRYQRLYTKPWVEKNWCPKEKEAFRTGAYPVGRDGHIYAVWDQDPKTWHSYNHSCSPNMKFDQDRSLNCVAVRDIAKGEELTMDYTTFMDREHDGFVCHCGSSNCKNKITFSSKPDGLLESPDSTPEKDNKATPDTPDLAPAQPYTALYTPTKIANLQ